MGEEKLTKAQTQAVRARGSNLLVSAAAGSGKTKVLVERLMGYLLDPTDPANIDEFLMITYTTAAAAELRAKIAGELSKRLAQEPGNRHLQRQLQRIYLAKISTVHGFCGDILREFSYSLDIPADFRIADQPEALELRQTAMDAVLEEAYEKIDQEPEIQALVNTLGLGRDDQSLPKLIADLYDSARCHLRPEAFLKECVEKAASSEARDAGQTPWGAYLLADLHRYLDGEIALFEGLLAELRRDDALEKAVSLYAANLESLKALRACATWDQVYQGKLTTFGRMPVIKGAMADPERWEQIKQLRADTWDELKKRQAAFYGDSEQVLADLRGTAPTVAGLAQLVRRFDLAFSREKERRRALDFGDLEHKAVELLLGKGITGPTAAAREIGGRFREVMVDEYQDSNRVQDSIFAALTAGRGNCFMVGDVKQSIYSFRLAEPGMFREKSDCYALLDSVETAPGRKVFLSENFRSGGEILAAANDVFSCAMSRQVGGVDYGPSERLREGVPHKLLPQPAVELHCLDLSRSDEEEKKNEAEANFVAQRIDRMLHEQTLIRDGDGFRRVNPEDIVILMRSPASVAGLYVRSLAARGIRCRTGDGENILEAPEICVLKSILQILDNPRQDIPLIAALRSPVFGFSSDRLGAIRGAHPDGCYFDALSASGDADAVEFCRKLSHLRRWAQTETLASLLRRIFDETAMDSVYRSLSDGASRVENLRLLYTTAAAFEEKGRKDLPQFLEFLDSQAERGLTRAAEGSGGAVRIMSIHKSKGLEFPVVFLVNLDRRFNTEDQKDQVLTDQELGIGCSLVDQTRRVRYATVAKRAIARKMKQESLSEELRVLYVAMTRPRDRLVMTYAAPNLPQVLKGLAGGMELPDCPRLSAQAECLGHWVLMCAMTRTEAQPLFALGGRPKELAVRDFAWSIQVHDDPAQWRGERTACSADTSSLQYPDEAAQLAMMAPYPHAAACTAPSKRTATQLKGRALDEEAAQDTRPARSGTRPWRRPSFMEAGKPDGREAGVAMHLAMQFIRYEACTSPETVGRELERLVQQEFLTSGQAALVDCGRIARFFETPLGRRLQTGKQVLREFKFSILEPGEDYDPDLAGEQILLQGVVDCCLLEPDGITVLDFKTDRIGSDGGASLARRYGPQVRAYGRALERIYGLPVKRLLLYLFSGERFLSVED